MFRIDHFNIPQITLFTLNLCQININTRTIVES